MPEWCTHASLASTLASHGDGSVKIIRSEGSQSAFPSVQSDWTGLSMLDGVADEMQ